MTTALSLLASGAAMIAVLTISAEARADGPKQGASTAQVLAQESAKPPQPKAAPHAHHANANAKAKAQPHPKAKARAKAAKPKSHAKPAKAPAKPAKPAATARA